MKSLNSIAHYPAPARLGLFIFALALLWLPVATPIYLLWQGDHNWKTIVTMGLLFADFLLLLPLWGKYVYGEPALLSRYGAQWTRFNGIDLLNGSTIAFSFTSVYAVETMLGWIQWQQPSESLLRVIGEGWLVAFGVALAEELLFRGWLLDELERDYSPNIACWADGFIFALLHFLKPIEEVIRTLPQFPSLVLLGLSLVWAKRSRRGRLGIAIGLHGGLVWGYYIINVGELVKYRDEISPWITGIDGNPLAGLMGIIFMTILAFWMRKQTFSKNQQ